MSGVEQDYGLWGLVAANALFFAFFAGVLLKPSTRADWPLLGAFAVFVIAHFVERYGFPLTLYMLSAWLPGTAPSPDPLSHDAGHLWAMLFGSTAEPHASPLYAASYLLIGSGFWVLASASHALHHAQRAGRLATTGPYARVRHPQTMALGLIVLGFLLQWPTAPTLGMLPLLIVMAARLAQTEEEELQLQFGLSYAEYASATPACVPRPIRMRQAALRRLG